MLHQLHVLRQAPHGRAALAVERDGEELAVAAGRDQGAEGLALEEADAGELGGRDAWGAGRPRPILREENDEESYYNPPKRRMAKNVLILKNSLK